METKNKRIIYAAIAFFMLLFLGVIYAWSIFRKPFNDIFPQWTAAQMSLNFTISMTFFCIGGFISGKLTKKYSNRSIIVATAVLLFIGFFNISRFGTNNPDKSLIGLYLNYGVFCGLGVGVGYNAIITAITKWFPKNIGTISGFLLMGFGFGGMMLGTIVSSLIEVYGLFKSFFILSLLVPIILILGSSFIKLPEETLDTKSKVNNNEDNNFTTREMLSSISFWVFVLWNIGISSTGLLVINSAAPIASFFGAPAILGLLVSVFNGIGRMTFGTIFDKLGRKKTMTINSLVIIIAAVFLLIGSILANVVLIFVGLVLTGIGYGGGPPTTSAIINKFFGQKHYPVNFSLANFALIPASIVGPYISGLLQDKADGNYTTTFILMLILGTATFLLNLQLKDPMKREDTNSVFYNEISK